LKIDWSAKQFNVIPKQQQKPRGVRRVISTKNEARAAIVEIASRANRGLAILTRDLEPEIYDHDDFLETLKKFLLQRTFARVRVLISDPTRAFKVGNRFVEMGRRLNSYIEFRNIKAEQDHAEAFCIVDETGIVYRARADSWDGVADTYEPTIARRYLDMFDRLWNASADENYAKPAPH
jgi:hypothetical protein